MYSSPYYVFMYNSIFKLHEINIIIIIKRLLENINLHQLSEVVHTSHDKLHSTRFDDLHIYVSIPTLEKDGFHGE